MEEFVKGIIASAFIQEALQREVVNKLKAIILTIVFPSLDFPLHGGGEKGFQCFCQFDDCEDQTKAQAEFKEAIFKTAQILGLSLEALMAAVSSQRWSRELTPKENSPLWGLRGHERQIELFLKPDDWHDQSCITSRDVAEFLAHAFLAELRLRQKK